MAKLLINVRMIFQQQICNLISITLYLKLIVINQKGILLIALVQVHYCHRPYPHHYRVIDEVIYQIE